MQTKSEIAAELVDLSQRAATIADHIVRAAQAMDAHTIQDLTPSLGDLQQRIDQASFALALTMEGERTA